MDHILNDINFQNKLIEIAQKTGRTFPTIHAEAKEYLEEMYTAHKPVANLLGVSVAQYILSRGYHKTIDVNIDEVKKVAKLARQHPVAFVMTHKTYIDMFVLAIVLVRHGLPIPHIFAGINMNFMGVSQLGKNNGVIFIRRSFKDNLVYKATLRYFIASIVNEKGHFMWAIEGTRSRTGKLVWPKMGILKYIKEAEAESKQTVKYVPVSVVYDLIPDVDDMTKELKGKMKNPENLSWFINYIKKMGDKFGRISLRFAPPVDTYDDASDPGLIQLNSKSLANNSIPRFALELVHRINQYTPVTTPSLICISLLSKYALSKRAIESDVSALMNLIEDKKSDALVDRGRPIGESVQTGLNLLLKANLIKKQGEGMSSKYMIVADNYLSTTYYANMSVHHLYHRSFIELAMVKIHRKKPENRIEEFWKSIMEFRDLFKFEFFYSRKAQFSDEIEAVLLSADPNWEQTISHPDINTLKLLELERILVAPVVLNSYIEAYKVVAHTLLKWDRYQPFDDATFLSHCIFLGEEMQWQGHIQRTESVAKPFLTNGIRLAKNLKLIPDANTDKTEEINSFLEQIRTVGKLINEVQSITLAKPQETNSIVPIERDIVPGSKTEGITREIMEGESGPKIGAFFDLDRTLIKGFSAKEFFQTRIMSGQMTSKEIMAQLTGIMVYATGNRNFAGLAASGAQGVEGVKESEFIKMGEEVYQKHLADQIYPESRALVMAHLAKGHTVAIISAATPYQVEPIARDLGIKHVMCTRMEVKNGKFTGKMIEPACWGEGKSHAAKELCKKHNLDLKDCYFYTDSYEDLPLLEIVGHPRPMNADTKLSALAFQNNWPIYRFNDENHLGLSEFAHTGLALAGLVPAVLNGMRSGTMNMSWQEGINAMTSSVGDLVLAGAGIKLVVSGEQHLWSHRPAIFILNHQSNVDMFIAIKLIRKNVTGIAKKELQMMPVIGQLMQMTGVIFIDRKNKEKAIEAMKPAVDALKGGTSFIIFPEGTRSKSYKLGAFKKGAFHLAMQAGVPLIPIVLQNAHDAMPRGSNVFRPAAVKVNILPPISVDGWNKKNLNNNINKVRNLFLKELGQLEETKTTPKTKQNGTKTKS